MIAALAAMAVADLLGLPLAEAGQALGEYQGSGRRFELRGEVNGITVIDDYAHHPTEIKATLSAARSAFPERRIIVAFQPHLYSRTRDFYEEFGKAFLLSDVLIVTDVYPAREEPIQGVSGELIVNAARDLTRFSHDLQALMSGLHASLRNLEKTWRDHVSGKPSSAFAVYSPRSSYSADQLLRHPKFGDGFVERVMGEAGVPLVVLGEAGERADLRTACRREDA